MNVAVLAFLRIVKLTLILFIYLGLSKGSTRVGCCKIVTLKQVRSMLILISLDITKAMDVLTISWWFVLYKFIVFHI